MFLRINAQTCFGLSSWPSSGSTHLPDVCNFYVNLLGWSFTYIIRIWIKIKILKISFRCVLYVVCFLLGNYPACGV